MKSYEKGVEIINIGMLVGAGYGFQGLRFEKFSLNRSLVDMFKICFYYF